MTPAMNRPMIQVGYFDILISYTSSDTGDESDGNQATFHEYTPDFSM